MLSIIINYVLLNNISGCHGIPWGVPWDPRVGTMGAPWVGSLSLLGLKGPLGLLDPWASLDPRASWHPREPRGTRYKVKGRRYMVDHMAHLHAAHWDRHSCSILSVCYQDKRSVSYVHEHVIEHEDVHVNLHVSEHDHVHVHVTVNEHGLYMNW